MTLTIDSQPCDLPQGPIAVPGFDARDLSDPERCRTGRTLRLTLPPTPVNDRALGFARDPHCGERFDAALHRAELAAGGAVLLAGTVRLLAAGDEGYTVEIRAGGALWAKQAARMPFNRIAVACFVPLTPSDIASGWRDDTPLKFLPVHRDAYPLRNDSADLLPAERPLSTDDCHPFLHVATLVEAIAAEAGYRIESRFFATEFFRSLYMSGAYAARDTATLRSRMDFRAGRTTDATAAADNLGRVYATPTGAGDTVGALFDTAQPAVGDDATGDLFDNGRCFGKDGSGVCFRPTTEIEAGFEYLLRYTTAHRILTRERLRGIDGVVLGPGCAVRCTLPNRYPDRRTSLAPGYGYRAVVFDHRAGAQYRLTCTRDGASGTLLAEFAARTAAVTTPASGTFADPVLLVRDGGAWTPYAADWALYDGYVGETGQTTVCLRVRTPVERITPTAPKRFDTVYFHGAEQGMTFTLHAASRLRPCFSSLPGYGEVVAFADAAQHEVRQIVLLEALQHLFNLRFLTDEAARRLVIEPADDLYDRTHPIDWSGKTDFFHPVELRPIAPELHEIRTRCYRDGEGAVARRDAATDDAPFGSWSVRSGSYASLEGEERIVNPLFSPTLLASGPDAGAPSALLPQVGDRDAAADGERFAPRILRYCGMHPLPEGERWSDPAGGGAYPLAAFHFAGDGHTAGFTLCFEDRDGQRGLHRFYDRQTAQEHLRERVTLWLRLEPHEFEALLRPDGPGACLRSVFRLDVGGETILATLHRIETYDPDAASTRCTFMRLPED